MRNLLIAALLCCACAGEETTTPQPVDGGAGGGGGTPVDCDQDHDGEDSPECGGKDCCDTDPNVPSSLFHEAEHSCGGYDWNCDGGIEVETADFDDVNRGCTLDTPNPNDCQGSTPGWLSPEGEAPLCGETAPWLLSCAHDGEMTCVVGETEERTQRCR